MQIITISYHSTNYYILDNGKGKLLIDAGWPGTFGEFKHVLQKKDIKIDSINYLVVTHYHPDHAGLVQELKDSGLKLIVFEEQKAFIPLFKNYIKPGVQCKEITLDDNIVLQITESRKFLKKLGFKGEVVYTPGHSNDSVTLILDTGEAFTGDLPPNYFSDDETCLVNKSWKKLAAIGVTTVYPGYGPKIEL